METITRIRKIYQPLSLTTSVGVEGVSVSQVVNQFENTVSPQRSQSLPTRLVPKIEAYTGSNDPSWTDGSVNSKLVEIAWLANGEDISISSSSVYAKWHSAGSPLFSISNSGNEKGTLSLWKNLDAEESYDMQMRAKFVDSRTGRYYEVLTDAVTVSAQALGEAEWDFSVVHDVNIMYNPLIDRLRIYDYLVSKGETPTKSAYLDDKSYDMKLPLIITHGHDRYTPDSHISFELQNHLDSHSVITPGSTSVVTELTNEYVRLDLRNLSSDHIVIDVIMKVDGNFQSQEQLTISRLLPKVELLLLNDADIDLGSATRWEKVRVLVDGKALAYPEAYFTLAWRARSSATGEWISQSGGEIATIDQSALGINATSTGKSYLAVWLKADIKQGGTASYETRSVKHKVYAPLSIVTTIDISGKPTIQTDTDTEGLRSQSSPTILTPTVKAISTTDDASWTDRVVTSELTDVTWLVNGSDISRAFPGTYSIDANGVLRLWHNCKQYESHALQFYGVLTDNRTGKQYRILSDAVDIISQNPAVSSWDFSVAHDVNIRYNPLIDRLKIYDYLVEKGEIPDRNDYLDSTAYDLVLPILTTYGHTVKEPTDDVTFCLFNHADGTEYTTDNCIFLRKFTKSKLNIDLRFLPDETVVLDLCMYVNNSLRQVEQLTFTRELSSVELFTLNRSDVDLTAKTRWDKAIVLIGGIPCEYPEAYMDIYWEARTSPTDEWIPQGLGESVVIDQEALGIAGDFDIRVGYSIKNCLAAITTDDGKYIANQSGNLIITWI